MAGARSPLPSDSNDLRGLRSKITPAPAAEEASKPPVQSAGCQPASRRPSRGHLAQCDGFPRQLLRRSEVSAAVFPELGELHENLHATTGGRRDLQGLREQLLQLLPAAKAAEKTQQPPQRDALSSPREPDLSAAR
jgi:hypothetical protein